MFEDGQVDHESVFFFQSPLRSPFWAKGAATACAFWAFVVFMFCDFISTYVQSQIYALDAWKIQTPQCWQNLLYFRHRPVVCMSVPQAFHEIQAGVIITRVDRKVGLKIKLKGFFKDRGLNPSSRTAVKPAGRWKRAAWKSSLSNWYGATDLFLSFWKQKKKTKARARNSETKLFDKTFGSSYNPVGISNVPHLLTWTDHLNSFWQLSSLTFLIFWNLQYLLVSFCQLMIAAPNPMPGSLQPHPRQIAWYEGPACLAVPAFLFEHDLKWCGKETIYHIWLMDSKTYPFKPHRGWFPQVHFEISGWFNVSGLGHGGRIANQW